MSEFDHLALTGAEICRLMRQHRVTIAGLAMASGITKKRVRQVRAEGVTGFAATEWHKMITGEWLDEAGRAGDAADLAAAA